ncbi:MAG: hypothetical protein ABIQ55_09905 [Gemmatimonadaceae bacterium]
MAEPFSYARPILTGSVFDHRNVLRQMLEQNASVIQGVAGASDTAWDNISQDVAA